MPVEPSAVLLPGPWQHRSVSANGTRLHVAEVRPATDASVDGRVPYVLFIHGFPEFWWAWRHQLQALAQAGYPAAAADLRGYGASDKPPRGYDVPTLAADIAGLVRALGERRVVLVGHGSGGLLAWATAIIHPDVVERLVVLGMPHPLRLREALLGPGQLAASRYLAGFQLPRWPEHRLVTESGRFAGELLRRWGGPGFPDEETEARVREAICIPAAAHCALEYFRWAVRSLVRPDGWRVQRAMRRQPVRAPTLHLHGELDACVLLETAQGSQRFVDAPYRWQLLDGVGHYPHEERPDLVNQLILDWLADEPNQPDRRFDAGE